MATSEKIDRVERPTREQLDHYVSGNRPVVFAGLMQGQTASRAWDLGYLRSRIGERRVEYVRNSSPRLYWDPQSGLGIQTTSFGEFADRLFVARDGYYSYLQDDVNSFPSLKADFALPPMMSAKPIVRTKLWLSGQGLITPLHYDAVETFHWVIRGTKRFSLFPPGVRAYYPFSWTSRAPFISQVDIDNPDQRRFARFRPTARLDCEVGEGDILYLPAFWWHQVYSNDALNVSLNFVWFSSLQKSLRHAPQFIRSLRHVAGRLAQAKAKARDANALEPDTQMKSAS